jgi:hypothetical protein
MNETNRSPGTRGEAQPGDLTFRFPGGFAGQTSPSLLV